MNFHLEHHIAELLYRSIRGKLSDFEREELNQWRSDSPMHEALFLRHARSVYPAELYIRTAENIRQEALPTIRRR